MKPIKILRYAVFFCEILVFYILEQVPDLLQIKISGIFTATPMLTLITVVCISVFENEFVSVLFAVIAGILMDSTGSFGPNIIFLCICCFLVSYFVQKYLTKINMTASIAVMIICILSVLNDMIFIYAFHDYGMSALTRKLIPSVIYSWLLTPFIFSFNRFIATKLS